MQTSRASKPISSMMSSCSTAHDEQPSCGVCVKSGSPVRWWTRQLARSTLRSSGCMVIDEPISPMPPQRSATASRWKSAATSSSVCRAISGGYRGCVHSPPAMTMCRFTRPASSRKRS